MPISATKVSSARSFSPVTVPRVTATAKTRIALQVIARCFLPISTASKGLNSPLASTKSLQKGSIFSGAPLTKVHFSPNTGIVAPFSARTHAAENL